MRLTAREGGYAFEVRGSTNWAPAFAGRTELSANPPEGVTFAMTVDNPVLANVRALGDGLVTQRVTLTSAAGAADVSTVIDPAGLPSEITALFTKDRDRWRVRRAKTGEVDVERAQ